MGRFVEILGLTVLILNITLTASYPTFEYCNGTSWIKFDGYCYLFESKSQQRVSYYDAEDYCRSQGAHLVSIHSERENEFILNAMDQGRYGGRLWIGLNLLGGENDPKWSDDTPVDYERRVKKEFYKQEKCFMMYLSQRGWRPEHCALHYAPICKRQDGVKPTAIPPPTTVTPPTGYCPLDWIQFGQNCYKYFGADEKDRLKYVEARAACRDLGSEYSLVAIHSMEEQAFLTQHLSDLGTSAWIGINKVESDEIGHDIVFGWVDNSRNDFAYWRKGHPPPGTWKYCGRLSYEGVNKGEWIADYCEVSEIGYICQTSTDPSFPKPVPRPSNCEQGFQEYRNSCYRYMAEPKTREKAEETCQASEGHVVSILDGFEQAFLYNFLINESKPIGIGLQSVSGTRLLRWTDKQPLYYSNWADDKPRLISSNESCIFMDYSNNFMWTTAKCDLQITYVCKISKGEPPKVPAVLGDCPTQESWLDIGDKFCYHVADSPSHIQSWDATSRYCLTKGLKMISLHSDHETKSLVAYLWRESWNVHLGLIRTFDKKSFMWIDGSPLNYTNWEDREPSSWSNDKSCVAFSPVDGKWIPIHCGDGGVAICRADKNIRT